jgi:hypothetical protein
MTTSSRPPRAGSAPPADRSHLASVHIDELALELALDDTHALFPDDDSEAGNPRAHLAICQACAALVASFEDTLAQASLAAAPVLTPRPALRDSLLAATDPATPLGPYLSRLSRLFDLSFEGISKVVKELEDAARWEPTLLPTVRLFHFDGGPAYAKADNGFVRWAAGSFFPKHKHIGEETTLVVSGRLLLDDGTEVLPGELLVQADGSEHAFRIPEDEDCVGAVRMFGHIEPV